MSAAAVPMIYRPLTFRGPFDVAPPVRAPWSHRSHPYKFGRPPVVVPKGRMIDMLGSGLVYMDGDIASPVRNSHILSRTSALAGNNIYRISSFRSVAPVHDVALDPSWPLWTAGPDAATSAGSTAGETGSSTGGKLVLGKMELSGNALVFAAVAAAIAIVLWK